MFSLLIVSALMLPFTLSMFKGNEKGTMIMLGFDPVEEFTDGDDRDAGVATDAATADDAVVADDVMADEADDEVGTVAVTDDAGDDEDAQKPDDPVGCVEDDNDVD